MIRRAIGVDVSHWQGAVDWGRMAQNGVKFAFIKASQGVGGVDKQFRANWDRAKEAGLLRGAYHFLEPNYDGGRQARHLYTTVNKTGSLGELPFVIDVERRPLNAGVIRDSLVETKRLAGKTPIVYTSGFIWNEMGGVSWADDYPLWVAQYPFRGWDDNTIARADRSHPDLPQDWTTWLFWQFSDKGPGRDWGANSAGLDVNFFNGSVERLYESVGLEPPPEDGDGPPSPPPVQDIVEQFVAALNTRLPDEMIRLYDKNAVHITAKETRVGINHIRTWYAMLFVIYLKEATFRLASWRGFGASRFFTWEATLPDGRRVEGSDTLAVLNGKIGYHHSSYSGA